MGKRKNRKRENSKQKQRAAALLQARSYSRYMANIRDEESNKESQKEFQRRVAEKQRDIISTTVFVTGARDLRVPQNLKALEEFFESNFGPVRQCTRTQFQSKNGRRKGGRYQDPRNIPARVRFLHQRDASRVFGGRSLVEVTAKVDLACPVGFKNNTVYVRPSQWNDDVIKEELRGTEIILQANAVAIGEWFPWNQELTGYEDEDESGANGWPQDEWVEFKYGPACKLRIDSIKRTVELINAAEDGASEYMIFRFKQLPMPIQLCKDHSSQSLPCRNEYALVFPTKFSPKLEHHQQNNSCVTRIIHWGDFDSRDLGRCHAFKVVVSEAEVKTLLLHESFRKLQTYGVFPTIESFRDAASIICRKQCPNTELNFKNNVEAMRSSRLGVLVETLLGQGKICVYHACQKAHILEDGTNVDFVGLVDSCDEEQSEAVLSRIAGMHGVTRYPAKLFALLLDSTNLVSLTMPEYCISIPHVQVTPCRTQVLGFTVEPSNRVTRCMIEEDGFCENSFLRIHMVDEDGQRLLSSNLSSVIEERLKQFLNRGITVAGRHYDFLSCSSSQLKECSAWMICLPPCWSMPNVRALFGNFSSCTTVSKFMARFGQCLSTTFCSTEIVTTAKSTTVLSYMVSADVSAKKDMDHSDGTGIISRKCLDSVLNRLPIRGVKSEDVSIVQIRFKGAKGTLTAWQDPSGLKGIVGRADIYLRPSMVKFTPVGHYTEYSPPRPQYDAPLSELEVCSVGKDVPYYLNRQMILLLHGHGVAKETFLMMQEDMIDELDTMLFCPRRAMSMIRKLSGPDSSHKSVLRDMLSMGFSPSIDPFLFSSLSAIRNHHLFNLRKKARILVPKGTVLMGGLDETGLLPQGAVFFQLRRENRHYKPHVGPVLVTKHPVTHPGDTRMLMAVDMPELRGLTNVVLFSQHGSRPEADKMSGSDLDGDEFALCWDERLFLGEWNECTPHGYETWTSKRNSTTISARDLPDAITSLQSSNLEPMDFTRPPSDRQPTPMPTNPSLVTQALVNHLIDHLRNGSVGQIATMWLDYASMEGSFCEECLKLAELHSIAVDFPKSGIPAIVPKELILRHTIPRAHWRERNGPSFEDDGPLGMLYDEVIRRTKELPSSSETLSLTGRDCDKYGTILYSGSLSKIKYAMERSYDPNIKTLFGATSAEKGLGSKAQSLAFQHRDDYEQDLMHLMQKHNIRGEGEVVTGCIRKYHKLHKKRQHEFSQDVRRHFQSLVSSYRNLFFHTVKQLALKIDSDSDMPVHVGNRAIENYKVEETDHKDYDGSEAEEEEEEVLEFDDIEIKRLENILTNNAISTYPEDDHIFQAASLLAAAYYTVTYSPVLRWYHHTQGEKQVRVLFSFPWIVADVMTCCCLRDTGTKPTSEE